MMPLQRITLRPTSPWRTPWQADTLMGMLCTACVRLYGADHLVSNMIKPMLTGQPPFVLSDAFPGDMLPAPVWVRMIDWEEEHRKPVKRRRWLPEPSFIKVQRGQHPTFEDLVSDNDLFHKEAHQHNTLSRLTDSTSDDGGLFARPDTRLIATSSKPDIVDGEMHKPNLSVYFRAKNQASVDLLFDLFIELSYTGFGADWSTGRGQFQIIGEPVPVPNIDNHTDQHNGIMVISTFQPSPNDQTNGFWEAFPKFGRVGPNLGLSDVRKRTMIMFKPGACFFADPTQTHMGRAIPMAEFLPGESVQALEKQNMRLIHSAFGLSIPATLPEEFRI